MSLPEDGLFTPSEVIPCPVPAENGLLGPPSTCPCPLPPTLPPPILESISTKLPLFCPNILGPLITVPPLLLLLLLLLLNGITDSSVILYPVDGYGNPELLHQLIQIEKPDAIMLVTDPRYFIWLFAMENEIRKDIPITYLNIWDDYPAPLYNRPYYEACDLLMGISKQTVNINNIVLGDKA